MTTRSPIRWSLTSADMLQIKAEVVKKVHIKYSNSDGLLS